jgi:DNA-binding response OmpR family regulator
MSHDADIALSILLVEDDPVHAHLAQAALQPSPEGCDWRLTHVSTLAAACALAETPDLVLLDLTLPDGSGLDTLRRLRERFAFVPVVLLTGVEDPEIEATAVRHGAASGPERPAAPLDARRADRNAEPARLLHDRGAGRARR